MAWRGRGACWYHFPVGWLERTARRGALLLLCIFGLTVVMAAAARMPRRGVAVIYPDVGEPYRSVFSRIIGGVDEQAGEHVPSFAVGANTNPQEIENELRRQDIHVVITLGRNGLKLTSKFTSSIHVVAGGVLSIPEAETQNILMYSLAPDPGLLFDRLQAFKPVTKRVFVVYDPNQNAWLMRLAKAAARARGLELVSHEATDLKTALRIYQNILASADPRKDALWLPQDSTTVDESLVLPLILQESWARDLIFFSSSVAHVGRGALFSLYPDNIGMGHQLATSAIDSLSAKDQRPRGVMPMKTVQLAVNVRTAAHLGVGLTDRQSFDLVFPEQ